MSMVKCTLHGLPTRNIYGHCGYRCFDMAAMRSDENYEYGTPAQLEQDMLDDQERELKSDKPDDREGVEL